MLLRNDRDRPDCAYLVQPPSPGTDPLAVARVEGAAGDGGACAAAAADPVRNPDVAMQASGFNACTKFGFNFQLAHSSQNPVTELPPSSKGVHVAAWERGGSMGARVCTCDGGVCVCVCVCVCSAGAALST